MAVRIHHAPVRGGRPGVVFVHGHHRGNASGWMALDFGRAVVDRAPQTDFDKAFPAKPGSQSHARGRGSGLAIRGHFSKPGGGRNPTVDRARATFLVPGWQREARIRHHPPPRARSADGTFLGGGSPRREGGELRNEGRASSVARTTRPNTRMEANPCVAVTVKRGRLGAGFILFTVSFALRKKTVCRAETKIETQPGPMVAPSEGVYAGSGTRRRGDRGEAGLLVCPGGLGMDAFCSCFGMRLECGNGNRANRRANRREGPLRFGLRGERSSVIWFAAWGGGRTRAGARAGGAQD